ncbi:MAG TPA: pyridoxamine 5'-phosphate oxidase family protein [Dehalococcoidia bacterium]|nr:pyridoxamine 5'-phosphate oxidase family protein [Dehalococcoidia bacterium]
MPLVYHAGQVEVQEEANTRRVAGNLAHWVGPVGEFCAAADLIILDALDANGVLRFGAISGDAPLVEFAGDNALLFPPELAGLVPGNETLAGGIAINMEQRRRARLNGRLSLTHEGCLLEANEAFTNCRKYVMPSVAVEGGMHIGPVEREPLGIDVPYVAELLARAETAFLGSISPDGQPDVSHRGGPPAFLTLDAAVPAVEWAEFIGDGMLKSAGNVRSTAKATLLVLDLESGDALEIAGSGRYETRRRARQPREDALQTHREDFPVQGAMSLEVDSVMRLRRLFLPRRRVERAMKITSSSSTDDQAPQ